MNPALTPIQVKLTQINDLLRQDKLDQAKTLSQRLVQSNPNDAGVNAMHAVVLARAGLASQGIFYAKRASDLLPHEPELHVRHAQMLAVVGKPLDALPIAQRALALAPALTEARSSVIANLVALGRYVEACEVARAGLPTTDPNLVAFAANAFLQAARVEECVALYRAAAAQHPTNTTILANLANALNYMPGVTPAEVFDVHRAFGRAIAAAAPPTPMPRVPFDAKRPLRVGLISPDLRRHSVAYFIEPWLAHHDRAAIEVHAYSTSRVTDDMTARLRAHAKSWRDESASSDAALLARLRADRLDIILELSGHTVGNSLSVLARRAAPIQVTYLGYPNTTGLATIDARLIDSITDPAPSADALATERLLRLDPCFLCFSPPPDAPEPAPGPLAQGQPLTFGSFNTAQKLNAPLLALWAKLLQRVPDARLVLKSTNFADEHLRADIAARFAALGIDPARLTTLPPRDAPADHLAAYEHIDIALDPLPYHGTTTTCEALWMGVPVVTLAGDRHVTRVGPTLLSAVGLTDLIARDQDHYLALAASLAADAPRLADLRRTLRPRMAASPLRDAKSFAARLDRALIDLARTPA